MGSFSAAKAMLINENRGCVTIQPFSTFGGEIVLCQMIFAGKGITSHMVPAVAVESIKNFLVSTTPNGVYPRVFIGCK